MHALDTNSLIYFFKGQGRVAVNMLALPPEEIAIPAVVLYELETGIADGRVREVLGGLGEGDRVILHPDDAFEDGMRVEPLGGE